MIFKKANNLDVFSAVNTVKTLFLDFAYLPLELCTHTDVKRSRFGSSKYVCGPKQFLLCQ